MTKEMIKEAVKLAEQELKDEEKMRIKEVVKTTLEVLRKKEIAKHKIDEEIKILRKDISDMKEGRIDRIKERQDIDANAKEVSVIIIKEKIIEKQLPMWYCPWIIEVKPQYIQYIPTYTTCGTGTGNATGIAVTTSAISNNICGSTSSLTFTSTNSNVHLFTSGTYQLSDGTIKYI